MSALVDYRRTEATYTHLSGHRYNGNPFVEALPIVHWSKEDILHDLRFEPPKPTKAIRELPELIRAGELNAVTDIVYPRPAYEEAAFAIISNLLETYVFHNPIQADDMRRRHQLANVTETQLKAVGTMSDSARYSLGWRRTAPGYCLLGATGTGKTTLLNALMQRMAVVIQHRNYRGVAINRVQIPAIRIQVPFDATLRTFCLQFFRQVDLALGRDLYESQAVKRNKTVGSMVLQLFQVCSAISLGMLIVDDAQNLRAARGVNLELALNLFSLLMEIAGVAVVIAGTPAFGALIEANSRNIRKLTSGGSRTLGMMGRGSEELAGFQKMYAPYQYTTSVAPHEAFGDAWYDAGAGNPAFMSLAFMAAQRHAIGRNEVLSAHEFERALNVDMALLKPAVMALIDNDLPALKRFEDLIFRDELKELLKQAGISPTPSPPDNEELDDEDPAPKKASQPQPPKRQPQPASRRAAEKSAAAASTAPLPTEDALGLQRLA